MQVTKFSYWYQLLRVHLWFSPIRTKHGGLLNMCLLIISLSTHVRQSIVLQRDARILQGCQYPSWQFLKDIQIANTNRQYV